MISGERGARCVKKKNVTNISKVGGLGSDGFDSDGFGWVRARTGQEIQNTLFTEKENASKMFTHLRGLSSKK